MILLNISAVALLGFVGLIDLRDLRDNGNDSDARLFIDHKQVADGVERQAARIGESKRMRVCAVQSNHAEELTLSIVSLLKNE